MVNNGGRRARRVFSEEFRAGAVRLVLDEGKSVGSVARDLDLTESALRHWVERALADRTNGKSGGLTTVEREELAQLRKEVRQLRLERDGTKKSGGVLRQRERVKFAFIQAENTDIPITTLCRILNVSRSGYYAWCERPESEHAQQDHHLRVRVRASFEASRQRYGSPRVWEDLIEDGIHVSRKRVVRLMQEEGLVARARKRFKSTTMSDHDQPVATNLLNREFTAAAPNQRWVGDTTEFVIGGSGKLYLAAILDLYSRFVVGWAISAINDRHLAIRALDAALKRRCPAAGLLHHSDQGSPYASEGYQTVLEAQGITCSMSRRGNCYDNAVMESFFSSLKNELSDRFASHGEAKMELFDYIEVFYNQRRRHSTIGQVSPAAFEKVWAAQAA
ncbi:MAG: IS3 family transposase [Candidatus Eisenbacteria bacterium]